MEKSTQRVTAAAQAALAPGERITSTGVGWAAARRDSVPLLFQARRQYWMVLTDRRLLVFERHRGGPGPHDLVLAKRYDFFTLEAVKRARPLLQVRVKGATGARQVLEFRPGHRRLGSELVARTKGQRTKGQRTKGQRTKGQRTRGQQGEATPEPAAASGDAATDATTAAFWGER